MDWSVPRSGFADVALTDSNCSCDSNCSHGTHGLLRGPNSQYASLVPITLLFFFSHQGGDRNKLNDTGLGGGPPLQQLKKVFGSQYKIFSKLISDNKLVFSEVFLQ